MPPNPENPAPPPLPAGCRPLRNPFEYARGHDCFGCSPKNPRGLRLRFFEDGDRVFCRWKPDPLYQSWDGVLHGGIIAAILDETAGWTVLRRFQRATMTTRLDVKFLKPTYVTDSFLVATAWLAGRRNGKIVVLHATLADSSGAVCAEADADYYVMDDARSRAMGFTACAPE